jgi:hypothetical protein
MSSPIHDHYTLMLQTLGFEELTRTGIRIVLSSAEAPIRANIGEQHDPMEMLRYSKDDDIEAIRMYIRNDFSIGHNVYITDGIIQFSSTPAIELLVDPITCELLLRFSGGADIRRWGCISASWTQINTTTVPCKGYAFGEYGVWLLGYHMTDQNFGIMAKQTFLGDWDVIPGIAGDIMANITTAGPEGKECLGRGALFIGDDNNYRFCVDETGRLTLAQKVAGRYQMLESW